MASGHIELTPWSIKNHQASYTGANWVMSEFRLALLMIGCVMCMFGFLFYQKARNVPFAQWSNMLTGGQPAQSTPPSETPASNGLIASLFGSKEPKKKEQNTASAFTSNASVDPAFAAVNMALAEKVVADKTEAQVNTTNPWTSTATDKSPAGEAPGVQVAMLDEPAEKVTSLWVLDPADEKDQVVTTTSGKSNHQGKSGAREPDAPPPKPVHGQAPVSVNPWGMGDEEADSQKSARNHQGQSNLGQDRQARNEKDAPPPKGDAFFDSHSGSTVPSQHMNSRDTGNTQDQWGMSPGENSREQNSRGQDSRGQNPHDQKQQSQYSQGHAQQNHPQYGQQSFDKPDMQNGRGQSNQGRGESHFSDNYRESNSRDDHSRGNNPRDNNRGDNNRDEERAMEVWGDNNRNQPNSAPQGYSSGFGQEPSRSRGQHDAPAPKPKGYGQQQPDFHEYNPSSTTQVNHSAPRPLPETQHAFNQPLDLSPTRQVPQQIAVEKLETVHVVQTGESYWTISKRYYDTGKYFTALEDYNKVRIPDPRKIRPGMKVLVPTIGHLEELYPQLQGARKETLAANLPSGFFKNQQGQPMYRIGESDTLSAVSKEFLGRASRWQEIYDLNQNVLKDAPQLKIGMELKLPNDASRVQIASEDALFR